jgi:PEP-CTERM motif
MVLMMDSFMRMPTTIKLCKVASVLAMLILGALSAGTTKANPLFFSNVSAFQNGNSTKVDLFSNPGTTIFGPQMTFSVDVTGTLGLGAVDTLRITYNEPGSPANIQNFQIPFDTVQPPFSLLFSVLSPGANFQGIPATLTVDLLNSSPDFIIPSGPNQGQTVDSYTYAFNVARPVPEPATLLALASGLAALGVRLRRRG